MPRLIPPVVSAGSLAQNEQPTIDLDDRAFSHIDPRSGAWTSDPGEFAVSVGASSRDLRSTVVVTR